LSDTGGAVSPDECSMTPDKGKSSHDKKIGHGIFVDRTKYELIDFYNPVKAVGDLALLYFGKKTMASHSVSGRQAPGKKIKKPQLPPTKLSIILNYVLAMYKKLNGSKAKILNKEGERIPLTIKLLRQAVMRKCYSSAAYK